MSGDTPQEEALRAIFVFLQENSFYPMWNGDLMSSVSPGIIRVKSLEPLRRDDILDVFQIYFLEGELCINRTRITAGLGGQGRNGFGLGAQFLELADPRCFDYILDVLRGKRMAIEEW